MEANQQIGALLKEFRNEFGITQQELAEILQIKTQQVSNYWYFIFPKLRLNRPRLLRSPEGCN